MQNQVRTIKLLGLLALFAPPQASAAELSLSVFGHQVAIVARDTEQALMVDGQELLRNDYVDIDDIRLVSGMPVMIGKSSPGGNICDGSPFVIALAAAAKPRIDGPIDNCRPVQMRGSADQLAFSTTPLPNEAGENWVWKPDIGFQKTSNTAFQTSKAKGWAQLQQCGINHPGDIFSFGEIAAQIDSLLGPAKASYVDILMGTGSGQFDKDYFIGTSCTRHSCGEEEALLVASIANRKVFLAWKPSGEKIQVRPPVTEWPAKAKAELRDWAAKWK
jgi:hypothetical protein